MATSSAQQLATSITSLYDVKNSLEEKSRIIQELYAEDAEFSDPLVHVAGVENVTAQMLSLNLFVDSTTCKLIRGSMAQSSVLTIDSEITYKLKWIPAALFTFKVRMFTVVELKNGKISRHTDYWDIASVVENTPFVGLVYRKLRTLWGSVSSFALKQILGNGNQDAIESATSKKNS